MSTNYSKIIESLSYTVTKEGVEELVNGLGAACLSLSNREDEDIKKLLTAILEEKKYDMVASPIVGDIYQDFYQKVQFKNKELFDDLAVKIGDIIIDTIYKPFKLGPTVPLVFDSVIIQHYAHTNATHVYGIPPHYDHKGFVELVVVLLLEGESLFHVAKDKECTGEVLISAMPMDLIVMRGYGFNGEDSRPVHYVKKIQEKTGRTSLSFRIYSKNEEHLNTIRKAFSVT